MPGTGGASLSSRQGQEPGRSLPSQSLIHQEEQEGPGGKKPAQVMLRPDSLPKGLVPVVSLLLTISCCNSHQRSHTEAQRSRVSLNDGTEDAQRSQQHRAGGGQRAPRAARMSAPCLHASQHTLPLSAEHHHDRGPDSRSPDTCLSHSCLPSSPSHASLQALSNCGAMLTVPGRCLIIHGKVNDAHCVSIALF